MSWYAFRQMRLSPQKLVETCSRDFDFKLDDWNQMHFCRHILLNISTTSCLFLKFKSVLESMHSNKCDCLLRSWWRRVLAILISSWMTGTRCIFANTFCWISQRPLKLYGYICRTDYWELANLRTVVRDTVYRYSTFVTNTSAYVRMST